MEENKSKKRRRVTDAPSCFNAEESNHRPSDESQEEGSSLLYLVLSKSWQAAALRATSHPQEAQIGCASLARKPVPLDGHNSKIAHNSINTSSNMLSSPLAIACRYGAPPETIQAILDANPFMVRRSIPNRGTPLHEAIMTFHGAQQQQHSSTRFARKDQDSKLTFPSSYNYDQVISMLLQADERIYQQELTDGSTLTKRATMLQDVDGNTPLHLLVRHAFYNYVANISGHQTTRSIMAVFQQLISSSPQASSMPDLSEFEETPLILVLKSSLHAQEQYQYRQRHLQYFHRDPTSSNVHYEYDDHNEEDAVNFNSNLEHGIFQACKLMLKDNPSAASVVASKTGYTPVHSAVYHGRCSDTIRLLLKADCDYLKSIMTTPVPTDDNCQDRIPIAATMRTNRFGETPLHFAAMRGECTKTIKLLSQAAPWAALKRDENHGLTPIHWLLARFFVTMNDQFNLNIDPDRKSDDNSIDGLSGVSTNGSDKTDADLFRLHHSSTSNSLCSSQQSKVSLHDPTSQFNLENDEQNQFDFEYHRRTCAIDPPCDYTQMRHILPQNEHADMEQKLVQRIITVLTKVRATHLKLKEHMKEMKSRNQIRTDDHQFNTNGLNLCPFQGTKSNQPVHANKGSNLYSVVVESTDVVVTTDHTSVQSSKGHCPFNHMAKAGDHDENGLPHRHSSSIAKACPYAHSINANQRNFSTNDDDLKRCPFRCPFVFESYPIDSSIMGVEGDALREEKIISLFWAKVNSLLHAAAVANIVKEGSVSSCFPKLPKGSRIDMLHTACSSPTPLAIIRLCAALHPQQLMLQDSEGKFPLHHAACRVWHPREFSIVPSSDHDLNGGNSQPANLLCFESCRALQLILNASDVTASKTRDLKDRIPFHYAIDSVLTAIFCSVSFHNTDVGSSCFRKYDNIEKRIFSAFNVLNAMIQRFPEAIEQKDGITGLYPFMQASAKLSEILWSLHNKKKLNTSHDCDIERKSNILGLSVCYELLLASPSLVLCGQVYS